ncbi:uncharacterized protein LOC121409296 [Lytechinus variegatus]|uniref:uncharacterized protein LOC121409296 n=1 Tax=Lytechinus variegatus TaxID=7654 RepID=UPI001BB1CA63|nr:uncharacterized protein LOC121409296 [Lytechinus variegatus]XP_041457147.1 uncharacterized protein LOC121409296 [Lytechinus variegatus]
MEPNNVIGISLIVHQGNSMIDSLMFQKFNPGDISSTTDSSSFYMIQDCLEYDSNQSHTEQSSGPSEVAGWFSRVAIRNKMGILEGPSSAQELPSSSGLLQVGSSMPNDEQLVERTQIDSTSCNIVHLSTDIDEILASCFMCEMRYSKIYREFFMKTLCEGRHPFKKWKTRSTSIILALHLRHTNLFKMEPDIRWSKKMLPLWLTRISIEDSFSWLSTLGGAYSALGDHFHHFAEKAGRVSIHQMKLACQLGDPILLAKCRVYMAQSLMQNGFIQHAMFIVRAQYRFAVSLGENTDQRLINMCRGVWSIIQYLHKEKEHRKNGVGLHLKNNKTR